MIKRAQFLLDLRGWAGKCTLRNKTALTGRWGPGMYGLVIPLNTKPRLGAVPAFYRPSIGQTLGQCRPITLESQRSHNAGSPLANVVSLLSQSGGQNWHERFSGSGAPLSQQTLSQCWFNAGPTSQTAGYH